MDSTLDDALKLTGFKAHLLMLPVKITVISLDDPEVVTAIHYGELIHASAHLRVLNSGRAHEQQDTEIMATFTLDQERVITLPARILHIEEIDE